VSYTSFLSITLAPPWLYLFLASRTGDLFQRSLLPTKTLNQPF